MAQRLPPALVQQLLLFVRQGNETHRSKQLKDWFQSLDWMPLAETDQRVLRKLPVPVQQALRQQAKAYQAQKSEKQAHQQQQRQDYRQRVDAYFRQRVSVRDKRLLEALRDYELELTGRDVNWQFHFRFHSFKRVDAFLEASAEGRQQAIAAFKTDVQTYLRNLQALKEGDGNPYADKGATFTFDDWCRLHGKEGIAYSANKQASSAHQQRQRASSSSSHQAHAVRPEDRALHLLRQRSRALTLLQFEAFANPSPQAIKQQFRQLTRLYHPDNPETGSAEKMKALLEAYQLLMGSNQRQA